MSNSVHPALKQFNKVAVLGLNQQPLTDMEQTLRALPAGDEIFDVLKNRNNQASTGAEFLEALALVQSSTEYSTLPLSKLEISEANSSHKELPAPQEEQQRHLTLDQIDLLKTLLQLRPDNEWLAIQLLAQFDACMPKEMFYNNILSRRKRRENISWLLTTASENSRWLLKLSPELVENSRKHLRPDTLPAPIALIDWLKADHDQHYPVLFEHWKDLDAALRFRYLGTLRVHAPIKDILMFLKHVWPMSKAEGFREPLIPLISRVAQDGTFLEKEQLWEWLEEIFPQKHYGHRLALAPIRGALIRYLAKNDHPDAIQHVALMSAQLSQFFNIESSKLLITPPSEFTENFDKLWVNQHDVKEEFGQNSTLSELLGVVGIELFASTLNISIHDAIKLFSETRDPMQWSDEIFISCHLDGRLEELNHWITYFRETRNSEYRPSHFALEMLAGHLAGPPLEPTLDIIVEYGLCQHLLEDETPTFLAKNNYQLTPSSSMKLVHWLCANKHVNPKTTIALLRWAAVTNIEPQQLKDHFAWQAVEELFDESEKRSFELAMEFKATFQHTDHGTKSS